MERAGSDYKENSENAEDSPKHSGKDKAGDTIEEAEEKSEHSDLLSYFDIIANERKENKDDTKNSDFSELDELVRDVGEKISLQENENRRRAEKETYPDDFSPETESIENENTPENRITTEGREEKKPEIIEDTADESMADQVVELPKDHPIWGDLRKAILEYEGRSDKDKIYLNSDLAKVEENGNEPSDENKTTIIPKLHRIIPRS